MSGADWLDPGLHIEVDLVTAWRWLSWPGWEDSGPLSCLSPEAVATVNQHAGHAVGGAFSAFGWRSLRCTDCEVELWTI